MIGITADVEETYLKLRAQYPAAVEEAGAIPLILPPSPDIEGIASHIDGLLIPGGDDLHPSYYGEEIAYELKIVDKKRSDLEISLIREIIKIGKPVLAICYGMQLLNVAFGGSLYQDIGTQMPEAMNHRKDSHLIRTVENRYFPRGEFSVNSSHHQAVKDMGGGLKPIAFSADNIIEAVCMDGDAFVLGVQWHPERTKDGLSEKIFRSFVEAACGSK
ncbi:MAG: gamma-glutamyl-gamma-aminobutyrate hydrolase family protein [Nitrospirae bacterium]|nr:gamma-glutamyl-gamma-aminobutyrate hydrolase family protein [Nitrospirota bacterium]